MNTYRILKVKRFPEYKDCKSLKDLHEMRLPGFTEDTITEIKNISEDFYGFEYFHIKHDMHIKDKGIAYGFHDDLPIALDFVDYKKRFEVKAYLNREKGYLLLAENSNVLNDLIRKLKKSQFLKTEVEEYTLELKMLENIVDEYSGAWFRGVSSRVSSSALYGADLSNEPLFNQLKEDGAELSSIIVPYGGIQIQINKKCGISSHMRLKSIEDELILIQSVKENLIDKIENHSAQHFV
ncbi:hypothetical protein [Marinifilum flexuosum]|uniref:hypothetical protein n=1 Tax=Marinifilum flexuosum TaxID=1117708 RepID=UPI0024931EC8|nr:hypothetical protein [Marinifilum flexuosum]